MEEEKGFPALLPIIYLLYAFNKKAETIYEIDPCIYLLPISKNNTYAIF